MTAQFMHSLSNRLVCDIKATFSLLGKCTCLPKVGQNLPQIMDDSKQQAVNFTPETVKVGALCFSFALRNEVSTVKQHVHSPNYHGTETLRSRRLSSSTLMLTRQITLGHRPQVVMLFYLFQTWSWPRQIKEVLPFGFRYCVWKCLLPGGSVCQSRASIPASFVESMDTSKHKFTRTMLHQGGSAHIHHFKEPLTCIQCLTSLV